jgi:hypothetical protein
LRLAVAILQAVFAYLFFLTALPPFVAVQENQDSFQVLHKVMDSGGLIHLNYGTRTKCNGVWLDIDVAERFISGVQMNFTLTGSDPFDFLSMLAVVLGTGFRHVHHFDTFRRYLTFFREKVINRPASETTLHAIHRVLAGMISSSFVSEHCYCTMFEELSSFWPSIGPKFAPRVTLPSEFDTFAKQFPLSKHNFLHVLLEKSVALENDLMSQGRQTAVSSQFAAEKASRVLPTLAEHEQFLHLQLHQFAASIRNLHTKGRKAYRTVWRSLSSEDGPWCVTVPIQRWRLDSSELFRGRRTRLITNYKYKDHKDASLMRDIGNPEKSREMYIEHLKRVRMSQFEGDQSVIATSGDGNEKEDGQSDHNVSFYQSKVIFRINANLVTMKRVFPGVMLLTPTSIIFQGSDSSKHK